MSKAQMHGVPPFLCSIVEFFNFLHSFFSFVTFLGMPPTFWKPILNELSFLLFILSPNL
jgi:hypothetical protein